MHSHWHAAQLAFKSGQRFDFLNTQKKTTKSKRSSICKQLLDIPHTITVQSAEVITNKYQVALFR